MLRIPALANLEQVRDSQDSIQAVAPAKPRGDFGSLEDPKAVAVGRELWLGWVAQGGDVPMGSGSECHHSSDFMLEGQWLFPGRDLLLEVPERGEQCPGS